MKKSICTIVIGMGAAAFICPPVRAADVITSNVKVSSAASKLNAEEWRTISLSASRILMHNNQAMTALIDKKTNDATSNIAQALKLADIIDTALPGSKVTTDISAGKLSYTDEDTSKAAFVPIFREYDTIDVISSIAEQRHAASSASPMAPDFTYASLDYTGAKLDLPMARRDLLSAQDLIKSGDIKGATAALQEILSTGVIFEFSTMDQPLVQAMDNLRLADSEFVADHPNEAKVALAGASDALKSYEKMTGDSRSVEVTRLEKEITDVNGDIAREKPETFSAKVSDWWSRCFNWLHI